MNLSGIPSDTAVGKLLRLPLRALPEGARVPILQGRLRGKRWIVGSGTHGCWLGSYEYEKRRLFERTIRLGSTVYDVGANVGFYTLLASVLVGTSGRVVAFEPVPRNLAFLREHLRLNRVQNVHVVEAAVAERESRARFDLGPHSSMGRLSAGGSLEVRTVSRSRPARGLRRAAAARRRDETDPVGFGARSGGQVCAVCTTCDLVDHGRLLLEAPSAVARRIRLPSQSDSLTKDFKLVPKPYPATSQ